VSAGAGAVATVRSTGSVGADGFLTHPDTAATPNATKAPAINPNLNLGDILQISSSLLFQCRLIAGVISFHWRNDCSE
jgi:hypothetical protein